MPTFESIVRIERPKPVAFPFSAVIDGTRTNKNLELRVWTSQSTLFLLSLGVWQIGSTRNAPLQGIEGTLPAGSVLGFGESEVTLAEDFDGRGTPVFTIPNSQINPYPSVDEVVSIISLPDQFDIFDIWGTLESQDMAQSIEQTASGPILIVAITAAYAFRIEDYDKVAIGSYLTDYENNRFRINGITLNSSRRIFETSAFREVVR